MSRAAFDFARRIGYLAHEAGRAITANPYTHRAPAFRAAWRDGWREAERAAGATIVTRTWDHATGGPVVVVYPGGDAAAFKRMARIVRRHYPRAPRLPR